MRALLTDLDGTLRDAAAGVPAENWEALRELGRRGVVRVVATGRSLHHARRALPDDAPLDWLIFASGAGWLPWPAGSCTTRPGLEPGRAATLATAMDGLGLSYCLQAAAPHSHLFHYREGSRDGTDFRRRLERHGELGRPLPPGPPGAATLATGVSQVLVFAAPGEDWPARLAGLAPDLRVLHSTSPLDGHSVWIELQPRDVSKGSAAALLMAGLGVPAAACRAVGNDFNDLDLLEWAGEAAVVAEAPVELRERFPDHGPCATGALARAARAWLGP